MRRPFKRALATTGLIFAAAAVPIGVAPSAYATPGQCINYLGSHGYIIGPKARTACSDAASTFDGRGIALCGTELLNIGVRPTDVNEACRLGWE